MEGSEEVLDSYGTGPKGTLGGNRLSMGSPSQLSPSRISDCDKRAQEALEAEVRMCAYKRYSDPEVRCDQHFKFYKRLVLLSSIHARKYAQNEVDKKALQWLLFSIEKEGWSDRFGYVTVCDDSIVPPDGPDTKVRSHLLSPTFSLVDGHRRVGALKELLRRGHAVPQKITVEVAVPVEGTSLGDTEVRLLEMAIRLNKVSPYVQAKNEIALCLDLRRLVTLGSWLKGSREFGALTVECLRNGDIPRAARRAVKERVIGGDIHDKHMQRYIRALLIFKHAPEAFEVYKRAIQTEGMWKRFPIIIFSSSVLLRAEPALKVLIIEGVFAHLDRRQSKFGRGEYTAFLKNFTKLYSELKEAAEKLGYQSASLLPAVIALPSGGNTTALSTTVREALIAAASLRKMCSTQPDDLVGVSTRLVEAITAAKKGGKTLGRTNAPATSVLLQSTTERSKQERKSLELKRLHQRCEQVNGEETASVSVAVVDTKIQQGIIHTGEESSNICSDESGAKMPTRCQALQDVHSAVKNTGRGQKRVGLPQPVSILRRKVLKRDGTLTPSRQKRPNPIEDADAHGSVTHISDDEEVIPHKAPLRSAQGGNLSLKQNRSKRVIASQLRERRGTRRLSYGHSNKIARKKLPNLENDVPATVFPLCIPEEHGARFLLSRRDVQSLCAELRSASAEISCSHNGTVKEVHDNGIEKSALRCVQFTAFWSDHRARLEQMGYTQIQLPTPLLTTAGLKVMNMENIESMRNRVDGNLRMYRDRKEFAGTENSARLKRSRNGEVKATAQKVCKDQMVVETALAVIAEWLGLYEVEDGIPTHSMSETGCSLLELPGSSDMRRPRLAFGLRSASDSTRPWDPPKDPSYMFVVSAETGFPMWIWERTHVLLQGPDELLPLIAKHVKPQHIYIESRSILVCRGDVLHAFGTPTSQRDEHHPPKPVGVVGHLVRRSVDQLEHSESERWWTRYVSRPCS